MNGALGIVFQIKRCNTGDGSHCGRSFEGEMQEDSQSWQICYILKKRHQLVDFYEIKADFSFVLVF